MELKKICEKAHKTAVEHGFYNHVHEDRDGICVPSKIALIHSELSEALEDDRIGSSKIGEELADAVIRIADLAEYLKIDLEKEIERKMKINEKRPFKHGKLY